MRYAYTTADGVRFYHPEEAAGWLYGQSGSCVVRAPSGVRVRDYPWHDLYVGPRADLAGRCVRCGEREYVGPSAVPVR